MSDVEITTTSWFSRIKNAFFGIIFGFILIVGSFYFIFWNEGNGLHTSQSLKQAQQVMISVPNSPVNPANDLHVVYLNGDAVTDDTLQDSLLGVSVKAIRLDRKVEMYQWQQEEHTSTQKNMGGSEQTTTTYTYNQVWTPSVIDSSRFHNPSEHQNPNRMLFDSLNQQAQHVKVGDFVLPYELISEIRGEQSIDMMKTDLTNLQSQIKTPITRDDREIFLGANPSSPQIGDLKISMTEVLPPQTISIIAQQNQNTLKPYLAPAGKKVMLLEMGQQTPQDMFLTSQKNNKQMTMIFRLVSLVMMIIGVGLLFQPLVVLADIIPFFGSIVGFGTGLVALMIGIVLWSVATAISWFAVRPLWALGLIAVAAVICFALASMKKKPVGQ